MKTYPIRKAAVMLEEWIHANLDRQVKVYVHGDGRSIFPAEYLPEQQQPPPGIRGWFFFLVLPIRMAQQQVTHIPVAFTGPMAEPEVFAEVLKQALLIWIEATKPAEAAAVPASVPRVPPAKPSGLVDAQGRAI